MSLINPPLFGSAGTSSFLPKPMFDDLETAETKTEDEERPSSQLYRWAHFPGLLVFGLLILPLHRHPWGWQIAIACGYSVFVFWFAFGSVLNDADDFFGDPRVLRYGARLLIPHLLVLAPLIAGVTLWFRLKPMLPEWVTHEGSKGSFWMLFGWIVLIAAGMTQGFWMAGKLKRRFQQAED